MRILLLEDDVATADALRAGLERSGFTVSWAATGAEALLHVATNRFDAVVLDVMVPAGSGYDVLRRLRAGGDEVPVLMLTARDRVEDRVDGLERGADDYLTKPFAFAELTARIEALGRRARPAAPPVLERAGICLDRHRRTVTRDGRPVELSRKEFAVLAELLRAEGGVVSAEQLLEKAWDEHADPFTGVVRFTIMMVRRKLGDPPIIDTVPGVGYRIP